MEKHRNADDQLAGIAEDRLSQQPDAEPATEAPLVVDAQRESGLRLLVGHTDEEAEVVPMLVRSAVVRLLPVHLLAVPLHHVVRCLAVLGQKWPDTD